MQGVRNPPLQIRRLEAVLLEWDVRHKEIDDAEEQVEGGDKVRKRREQAGFGIQEQQPGCLIDRAAPQASRLCSIKTAGIYVLQHQPAGQSCHSPSLMSCQNSQEHCWHAELICWMPACGAEQTEGSPKATPMGHHMWAGSMVGTCRLGQWRCSSDEYNALMLLCMLHYNRCSSSSTEHTTCV